MQATVARGPDAYLVATDAACVELPDDDFDDSPELDSLLDDDE